MIALKQESYRPDYIHFWQESIKDWHGQIPIRMTDDELEEQFWAEAVKHKKKSRIDPYAEQIFEALKHELEGYQSVIEIGPGWGNYTFPLTDCMEQLTCVDSSQAILDYLKDSFKERGQQHISYVRTKWEHVQHFKKHDVVFGINCFYRMHEIKAALHNMNKYATEKVIIGMTSGPIQPHYHVLEEQYGYEIKHARRDYIDLLNILYQMNIYANCKIIPLQRTYHYQSLEQLIAAQSKKILKASFNNEHVEKALSDFITFDNGIYSYRHDFHAALISWRPV